MRPNTHKSNINQHTVGLDILLENTNTGTKVMAEIASSTETSITVFISGEKIVLIKENNCYVGNKFGMELVYNPEGENNG